MQVALLVHDISGEIVLISDLLSGLAAGDISPRAGIVPSPRGIVPTPPDRLFFSIRLWEFTDCF